MKLNLGCGFNKQSGYINVDKFDACRPDLLMDVESLPWKFDSNEVDEVLFNHSLEHMGQNADTFLGIIKELYRVCKSGAKIQINVPHPRHDTFFGDPTHVRVVTPDMLALFSKKENRRWQQTGVPNTPLGLYLDVDFELRYIENVLEQRYLTALQTKQISEAELEVIVKERNNVVIEYRITLEAVK
jgi:ubiquinone/menaquinone biosynthesis C-methylase UbiE